MTFIYRRKRHREQSSGCVALDQEKNKSCHVVINFRLLFLDIWHLQSIHLIHTGKGVTRKSETLIHVRKKNLPSKIHYTGDVQCSGTFGTLEVQQKLWNEYSPLTSVIVLVHENGWGH
jgi:hypothetical protein